MLRSLKWVWNLWSDLITFEWLHRLAYKQPRLASAIAGLLLSVGLGLAAWYYLDPRFVIYEKNSYVEMSWWFRDLMGCALAAGAIGIVAATITAIRQGTPFIIGRSRSKPKPKQRTRRS